MSRATFRILKGEAFSAVSQEHDGQAERSSGVARHEPAGRTKGIVRLHSQNDGL